MAKLGQQLFFDKDVAEGITVAGPSGAVGEIRKVACVNCHDSKYFADTHQSSTLPAGAAGTNGLVPGLSHGRNWLATNTGQMVNLHWYEWTLWAGRFDSMIEHGVGVWGTSATLLAQASLRVHEVQGRIQRGVPGLRRSTSGWVCRRPIRPTSFPRPAPRRASARPRARSR